MDWRPTVLKKYWEGESSLEEEEKLRSHLRSDDDCDFFQTLKDFSEIKLPDGFEAEIMNSLEEKATLPIRRKIRIWRYAAAAVLFLGVGFTVFQRSQTVILNNDIVYDDPEEALEFTKQALMLFSTKMNEGMSYTYSIQEFDGAMEKIKN